MLANISVWQLLIVLMIAILIFGSGRIRSLGQDLGGMIRGFRSGFDELEETVNEIEEFDSERQVSRQNSWDNGRR